MYGYTKSTPLDCTYRFDDRLTITSADEGASVWRWRIGKQPTFIGTIINGVLRRSF